MSVHDLVQGTQQDVNKEGEVNTRRENSTTLSARNLNRAHHILGVVSLGNFDFLLLFFIFLFDLGALK
jgi:hypothetical protein